MEIETRLTTANAFHAEAPPAWALRARKSVLQQIWDFIGAPLRMVLLPDRTSERFHLTSLRAERLKKVLPAFRGRVLDIGCGDNMALRLYGQRSDDTLAKLSVGADIHQWTDSVLVIENASQLDFPDASFDTIAYIACLNHIPEREAALEEAYRLLKPGGRVVVTMIGSLVGRVGHALWWYSEDKQRDLHPDELMGLDAAEVQRLLKRAKFTLSSHERFGYGLNNLFIAEKR